MRKYQYTKQFVVQDNGHAELPETLAARERAFSLGKEAGLAQAQEHSDHILQKIHHQLDMLNANQKDAAQYLHSDILTTCQAIMQKLLPYLQSQYACQDIEIFVQESLSFLKKNGAVRIVTHSQNTHRLQSRLDDLPGTVAFEPDDALGISDCRIVWDDGGLEKITSAVASTIESALERVKLSLPTRTVVEPPPGVDARSAAPTPPLDGERS